jgi:hypothetical protein
MNINYVDYKDTDWTKLAHTMLSVAGNCEHFISPEVSIKIKEFAD